VDVLVFPHDRACISCACGARGRNTSTTCLWATTPGNTSGTTTLGHRQVDSSLVESVNTIGRAGAQRLGGQDVPGPTGTPPPGTSGSASGTAYASASTANRVAVPDGGTETPGLSGEPSLPLLAPAGGAAILRLLVRARVPRAWGTAGPTRTASPGTCTAPTSAPLNG
jgi:hypothetical protein